MAGLVLLLSFAPVWKMWFYSLHLPWIHFTITCKSNGSSTNSIGYYLTFTYEILMILFVIETSLTTDSGSHLWTRSRKTRGGGGDNGSLTVGKGGRSCFYLLPDNIFCLDLTIFLLPGPDNIFLTLSSNTASNFGWKTQGVFLIIDNMHLCWIGLIFKE